MVNWDLYKSRLIKNGINIRDRQIKYMKDGIISSFKDNPSFREVYFNGEMILREVQIVDTLNYNIKTVLIKPDESISVGDMLFFDDNNWLCTRIDITNPIYQIGTIEKCNNIINLYKNDILYKIPIVVESGARLFQLGTEDDKFFTTPATSIVVKMPFNNITMNIKRGDIYKIGIQSWKVEDVNDIIEQGLLILKMEFSQESQEEFSYNLVILNGSNIQVDKSQPLSIHAQLMRNNTIVPSPPLIYSSSDESIATIDENGLVTILDIGNVVFTVFWGNDMAVKESINVDIIEDEDKIDNYTVQINGVNNIIKGNSFEYNCVFRNNGKEIQEQSEFYLTSDDGISPTTLATIVSQDQSNNTCVIKANSIGYIKLWVKGLNTNIISEPFKIQIKNLF